MLDDQRLPDAAASYSQNVWIYSGKLSGMHVPTTVKTLSSSAISKAIRIPNGVVSNVLDSTWIEFQNPDTDVVKAPIVGDTYERYYFASTSQAPFYNTTARLKSGSANYTLGIPTPSSAMTLSIAGGSSATTVTRSYVWTYVSAYGEEGPPSPAVTSTGKIDATWTLTLPTVGSGDTTGRNLSKRRIYRTITSSAGVATYFLVTEIADLTTTSYADTQADTAISGNNQLQSTNWSAPPSDLEGIVAMPNGIIAGWRDNEIWFSEPYRPHAWPAIYTLAVEYPIVGFGVIGQTLVVATQGFPYAATGINPASISLSKLSVYEPCLSRGSIVSAPEGVYYASPNGLVLVGGGTVKNISKDLISKDKWQSLAPVSTLRAARVGTAYYAFGARVTGCFYSGAFDANKFAQDDFSGAYRGVLIDPQNARVAFNVLTNDLPTANVINDPWSGEVFIIRDQKVQWLNIADTNPTHEVFKWRSKKFELPFRMNLSAMRVYFSVPSTAPGLNPTRMTNIDMAMASDRWGIVRAYADDTLVAAWELRTSGELFRFPSGFKSEFWQFEVEARVDVKELQIASTINELKRV